MGPRRAVFGAILLVIAGLAGLILPAAVIFFSPLLPVSFPTSFIAYVAVNWWAILLVLLGVFTLRGMRKAAVASAESPHPPGL